MTDRAAIKRYNAERNAMLLKGSVVALQQFMMKHGLQLPSSDAAAEVTLHKTITGVRSLPLDYRKKSKAWLTERGLHSLDDGEL
jgi:hypothetical protein